MPQQQHLDRFEEWFIARKARQLVGRAGFAPDDVDDIRQDLRVDALQRLSRFNAAKSNRHSFITLVVRRCVATMLESRRAVKRNGGRRLQSLNLLVCDQDGREVELYQMLDAQAGRPGRQEAELCDLVADVRGAVASLPEHLRPWCEIFQSMGIRQASRELHVPRTRLQRLVREIRATFGQMGLEEYLRGK